MKIMVLVNTVEDIVAHRMNIGGMIIPLKLLKHAGETEEMGEMEVMVAVLDC